MRRSPLRTKLTLTEFYCVGCAKRVECIAHDIKVSSDKNGKPRLISKCTLAHKLYKYISPDEKKFIRQELKDLKHY